MFSLNLGKYKKAQIWINEFPEACFDSTFTVKETFLAHGSGFQSLIASSISVELSIPVGAMIIYGLLGAEFRPHSLDLFSFEIHTSNSSNIILDTSIYRGIDNAYVGLPVTYSRAIKQGLTQYFENKNITKPKGILTFKCAAYSEVGSNERIFEQLTIIICKYFFSGKVFEKKEEYLDLFFAPL